MSKKRIALITVAAFFTLIIVAGLLGYYFYLSPRLRIRSFTSGIDPIAVNDAAYSRQLNRFFKSMEQMENSNDFVQNPEKFSQSMKQASDEISKYQKEYKSMLDQINARAASPETEALKRSLTGVNEFYVEKFPELNSMFVYLGGVADSLTPMMKLLKNEPPQNSENMLISMSSTLKESIKKMNALTPPKSFASFQKNLLNTYSDLMNYFDEAVSAINNQDLNQLEQLNAGGNPASKDTPTNFNDAAPEFAKEIDAFTSKENDLLNNVCDSVTNLNEKYGSRWVLIQMKYDPGSGDWFVRTPGPS